MVPIHRNLIALIMVTLAVACGALAVLWPQWRAELGAQGYYGYGYIMLEKIGQSEIEPANHDLGNSTIRARLILDGRQ